jgi:hypothetical protein
MEYLDDLQKSCKYINNHDLLDILGSYAYQVLKSMWLEVKRRKVALLHPVSPALNLIKGKSTYGNNE